MRRLLAILPLALVPLAVFACVEPAEVDHTDVEALGVEAIACIADEDCASRCESMAGQAVRPVSPPVFHASRCEMAAIVTDDPAKAEPAPSCICMEDDAEGSGLLLSATGPDSCLVYGRNRQCVYHQAAFLGCSLDEPDTSCQAACAEVQRRLEVDALTRPSARLRAATCAETGCHCVLDIDGTCYVDDWLDGYDCKQSDNAIVGAFEAQLMSGR